MGNDFAKDQEKRIFNTIWNSATSYDYFPGFIGSNISGEPDFYFNIIIGLAAKYYGSKNMKELFSLWEDNIRSGVYDYIAWIFLEDLLFRKEVKERPVLKKLRKDYAENFFLDKNDPQRRKLALQSPLIFSLQVQKMRDVLGIDKKSMTKKEEEIYKALSFPEDISFEEIKSTFLKTYKDYLKFDPDKKSSGLSKFLAKSFMAFTFHPLERSIKPSYLFSEDKKVEQNFISSFFYSLASRYSEKKDRQIEGVFGKSLYNSKELVTLRERYCKDAHRRSRIWYTKGVFDKNKQNEAAARAKVLALERNKKTYQENILGYKKQIAYLARSLKSTLNSSLTSYQSLADHGDLIGRLAWKSKLPKENHIFSVKVLRETSSMSVDLLIDGSASLLDFQEDLAIEAYILAKSLEACQIPLRITAYASVDDYTVLTILKDFDEKASQDKIFSYYAQGWNRDGLAFRAYQRILQDKKMDKHLVLIMTDARPRDLKAYMTEGFSLNKSYDGKRALDDSKKALDKIRKKNISLAAIINTASKDNKSDIIENAKYLYGRKFASIDSAKNFAHAAGRLIKNEIGTAQRKN